MYYCSLYITFCLFKVTGANLQSPELPCTHRQPLGTFRHLYNFPWSFGLKLGQIQDLPPASVPRVDPELRGLPGCHRPAQSR